MIIGYCITILTFDYRGYYDFEPEYTIFQFTVIFALLIYYYFRSRNINFNYSFIENSKKEYYKIVFKKILKFSLFIMIVYSLCGAIALYLFGSIEKLFEFLLKGIFVAIILDSLYLFISYNEKVDYDDEKTKIKKTLINTLIVSTILSVLIIIINVIVSLISIHPELSHSNIAIVVYSINNNIKDLLNYLLKIFTIMFITFMYLYFKKHTKIKVLLNIYLLVILFKVFLGIINDGLYYAGYYWSFNSPELYLLIMKLIDYFILLLSIYDIVFIILLPIFILIDAKCKAKILILPFISSIFMILKFLNTSDRITPGFTITNLILQLIYITFNVIFFVRLYVKQNVIINEKNLKLIEEKQYV